MQHENDLTCQHAACRRNTLDHRPSFSRRSALNEHYRDTQHDCDPPCPLCLQYPQVGKPVKWKFNTGSLPCTHEGCTHRFKYQSGLTRHLFKDHQCKSTTCAGCVEAGKVLIKRRRLEEEKHDTEKKIQMQCQERRANLDQWLMTLRDNTLQKESLYVQTGSVPEWQKEVQAIAKEGVLLTHPGQPYAAILSAELRADTSLCDEVVTNTPALQPTRPSIEELAAYKDRMSIADADWCYTVHTFNLADYATLARIRRQRKVENRILPTVPTTTGRGYQVLLGDYLRWHLEAHPPATNDRPVLIKFSLDGAKVMSNKGTTQELGGFQILTEGESLASTKSPGHCHVFVIYVGGETEENLRSELTEAIESINAFIGGEKLTVGEREYTFDPVLTCDLKAMMKVLGLYDVFHPCSRWKCPYCKIKSTQLGNFDKKRWSFHRERTRKKIVQQLKEGTRTNNKYGIVGPPLLNFPLKHVIPCNLHCVMAITRKLLNLLANDLKGTPQALADLERTLLEKCKVKLVAQDKKQSLTFAERLKKSRLGRPEYLHILANYEHLFDSVDKHVTGETAPRMVNAREVWQKFYPLACLSVQASVTITARQWRKLAIQFGRAFVATYQEEDVMTYIHIFVYHYGYFLERFQGIEKFSNFALEGKHAVVKRILSRGTSHFARGPGEATRQQLSALICDELHDTTVPLPSSTPRTRQTWSQKQLPAVPVIQPYVKSSILT